MGLIFEDIVKIQLVQNAVVCMLSGVDDSFTRPREAQFCVGPL